MEEKFLLNFSSSSHDTYFWVLLEVSWIFLEKKNENCVVLFILNVFRWLWWNHFWTHFPWWYVSLIKGSSKTGEDSADSESALNTLASRQDTTATGHRLQPPQPPETQPQMEMAISSYNPTTGSTQSQLETKPTPSKVCVCIFIQVPTTVG